MPKGELEVVCDTKNKPLSHGGHEVSARRPKRKLEGVSVIRKVRTGQNCQLSTQKPITKLRLRISASKHLSTSAKIFEHLS